MEMPSSFELDKIMKDTAESLYISGLFKEYTGNLEIDDELKKVLVCIEETDIPKMLVTTPTQDAKKMMKDELSKYSQTRKDNPSDYQKQTNHLISVLAYSLLSEDSKIVKSTCEALYIIRSRDLEHRKTDLMILAGILEGMGEDSSAVKEAMKFRPEVYRLLGMRAKDVEETVKSFLSWYEERKQKEDELLDTI